jgi:hypothetical protein
MAHREWLVPVLLGLIAAGGVYALAPAIMWHPAPPVEPAWAFECQGIRATPGSESPYGARRACGEASGFLYPSPHLAVASLSMAPNNRDVQFGPDAPGSCNQTSIMEDPRISCRLPRVGVAHHNATRATVFVFNEEGQLAGSNAPASETARFAKTKEYRDLPSDPFYLGAGDIPAGMVGLPADMRSLARELLVGVWQGNVASGPFEDGHGWLGGGHLWMTVRLDQVLAAE